MKFKHTWKGDDVRKTYEAMNRAQSRGVLLRTLARSAEPIRAAAASFAPRSNGPGPHLADNIVVGETQFGASGDTVGNPDVVTVAIGPSHQPHDMFYGQFQEFGTAHHPAQPFMRPAWDQRHKDARRQFAADLRAEIAQAVKSRRSA